MALPATAISTITTADPSSTSETAKSGKKISASCVYSGYSLFFILAILGRYFAGLHTIEQLCERFDVSEKQFHSMNATQIHDFLIRNSFIPATVSVDSVQRFIRHNDLKSARDPNLRDRKAYEEDELRTISRTSGGLVFLLQDPA